MAKANAKKDSKSGMAEQFAKLSVPAMAGIIIGIAVFMSAIFYFAIYQPYDQQFKAANNNFNSVQSNLSKEKELLSKHQAVGEYKEPIMAAYQYMQRFLPQEEEMPNLVLMVADIAAKAGLIDGVTFFEPKLPAIIQENYAEIPFTMELEGEFLIVLNFLYDFSKLDRIINITSITVSDAKMVDARKELFHIKVKCAGSTYRTLLDSEIGLFTKEQDAKGGRRL